MVAHTIGERIVHMREQRNISQLELAENLQISTSALRNIEKGITEPRLSTLISLSDYFDVSIDYIVNGVSTQEDIKTFRETGLNEASLDALNMEIQHAREHGYHDEYVLMLNEFITSSFLGFIENMLKLRTKIKELNKELQRITDKLSVEHSFHDIENEFDLLKDRRDLLVWRFFREFELSAEQFIGEDEFRNAPYQRH